MWLEKVTFESGSRLSRMDKSLFLRCGLRSICIPTSVEYIDYDCFFGCRLLESLTFDSPSKVRFLLSVPSAVDSISPCCSIDIPDSVEILESPVGTTTRRHLVLSFGRNSDLRGLRITLPPNFEYFNLRAGPRAFVRLSESTLRAFRSPLSDDLAY
jgi:hypothetical protein